VLTGEKDKEDGFQSRLVGEKKREKKIGKLNKD
jgi:hypothetical protein